MIKKLLSTLFIAGFAGLSAQQVQNPGFETWTNNFPNGWGSIGEMVLGLSGTNYNTDVQTTSAHSGSFAMLMQNQYIAMAASNVPGAVNTGPVSYSTNGPIFGYQAYSSKPVSFDFWYKFNAINGDSASAAVIISKWNTGLNRRDTLAVGGTFLGLANSYTQKTVSIYWLITGVTPDSIQLHFTSSDQQVGGTVQPPTGGKLYVDDVNFTLPVGIQNIDDEGKFVTVYPNPAANALNISANGFHAKRALVYDLTGRNIATYELNGNITHIDISSYENGVYIYKVIDENTGKIFTAKFSVAK